ncbi:MAG TPA: TolC family protein [Chlorobaculum sp.]|jgi:outer membrane protein|uniref:Outer membrane protein, putative n=2 Tax=Chlorobaculum tepidum TaxID=1097 RepID=Q8KG61_CHLTE|nr:outer membrane protein, putative [Chlorobaculum tepidum TLS]HBU24365.1 TolC family protein [Chlorobaculum sp.]
MIAVSFSAGEPLLAAETSGAPLTLDEALRMTREHNPKARQALEELNAADAKVTESRSAWFPQISGKAGYTYLDPVSEMTFGGLAMKFMPNNNYNARFTAEMMLYDFGRTASTVDLAKAARNSARLRQDMTLRDLSLATVQAFYSVLFLQEAVRVQQKEVAALQTNLDHMQKRYDQGAATRFDLLTTQVRLAGAANREIDYQNQLRNQEITLRRLCGLDEKAPLSLKGSFDITAADMDADKLAASALDHRPEVMLARENFKAASYKKNLATREFLPKIVGSASWGSTNGYVPDLDKMRTNVAVGVELQVPIFDGFRKSAALREATAMKRSAEQQQLDAEQVSQAEVRQSVNDLKSSAEKIQTTRLQVSQADLAAKHARIRYDNGLATTLDLLDAEAALAEAELANLQARYEYVMNAYSVRRAAGDLIER